MLESIALFLGKDIFFAPTVRICAENVGWKLVMAPSLAAVGDRADPTRVRAIIIDLTPLSLDELKSLGAELAARFPNAARIAFGPHVQVDSFAVAAEAGFDPVLAKGAVASQLPKILANLQG